MATWNECNATIGVSSGKWYWEVLFVSTAELRGWLTGVRTTHGQVIDSSWGRGAWNAAEDGYAYSIWDDGSKTIDGTTTTSPAFMSALSDGDIIGFLLDLDSATTTFKVYVNNSLAGTLQSGLQAGQSWNPGIALADPSGGNNSIAIMNFGQDSSFAGEKTAQGNQDDNSIGDFYYDVPAGYLALCTSNLSAPSIADPTDHFNTKLYTGTGSELAIDSVGFQPDFTWIKTRTLTYNHRVFDAVRGVTEELYTNDTDVEVTDAQSLKSFDADGFTLGTGSGSNPSSTMISWNWKGDGVSGGTLNQDGDLDSQVNVNTTAGFSIFGYVGDGGVSATVGHGLAQTPELVIYKNRDGADDWVVYNKTITATDRLKLNDPGAATTASSQFNDTEPSASLVTIGTYNNINKLDDNYIAYAFHSVEGYSKIGSYEGNGDADGPFLYCGFRPAYVLIKEADATSNWDIHNDKTLGYNPDNDQLSADENAVMKTNDFIDIVSNGVKIRTDDGGYNTDSSTYIFYAIAETPFKTANAR
jgi:hypothetical protein